MSDSAKAIFLSYASQDAEAARRICEALRLDGIEVWFDQSELVGGDAWDAKIKKQIQTCALFVPIISAHTQAREEGYFRREWNLAANRTLDMAHDKAFLLPVVIDGIGDAAARVPEKFREVQWTRIGPADSLAAFCERVKQLLDGSPRLEAKGPFFAPQDQRHQGITSPAKRRLPSWFVPAIMGLVAVGVALAVFVTRRPSSPPPAAAAAKPPSDFTAKSDAKSIAVLPFENLSGDKGDDSFSDGISEELINVLGKISGLKVAGRTSSFYFKGKQQQLAEIAQQLGVTYVVAGSVQKAGERIRIRAQLIKASDGFSAWSDNFDREPKDIFAVQDEIAGLIAQNLKLNLGYAPRVAATVNPEAHRLVLEARFFWAQRTEEGFAKGEKACLRALEIDPQFAPAHAALADVRALRGWWRQLDGKLPSDEDFVRAKAEALLARRLDPTLVEPSATLGGILLNIGQLAASAEEFRQGIALNPNYAVARFWYSNLLYARGDLGAALGELAQAERLDPLFFSMLDSYARSLSYAGRYREALQLSERAAAVRPNVAFSVADRAVVLLNLGRNSDAVELARSVVRNPDMEARRTADAFVIHVLRLAGQIEEAEAHGSAMLKILPADSYVRGFLLAAMGRFGDALPYLGRTPPTAIHPLHFSSLFNPYRDDPRWSQLMVRLNCAEEHKLARASLAKLALAGK